MGFKCTSVIPMAIDHISPTDWLHPFRPLSGEGCWQSKVAYSWMQQLGHESGFMNKEQQQQEAYVHSTSIDHLNYGSTTYSVNIPVCKIPWAPSTSSTWSSFFQRRPSTIIYCFCCDLIHDKKKTIIMFKLSFQQTYLMGWIRHAFWLVLTDHLLEDRHIDDVTITNTLLLYHTK